ncbi:oligosaccharide flippase family protein [Candidatus Calescamantes bacterium]|nr:oligosaccharide flippase family protein [Candidatus Calescamantes bacterium]
MRGKDILHYVSANIFYKFSFYLLIICIAKFLGKGDLGKYFFLISLPGILLPFSEIGINTFLTREIARSKADVEKIVSPVLSLRLLLILTLYGSIGIVSLLFHPDILPLLLLSSLFLSLESFYFTFGAIFIAFQKIKYNILCGVSSRIFLLLFVYSALKLRGGLLHIFLGHLLASLLLLGTGWWLGRKIVPVRFRKPSRQVFIHLLRNSLPFAIIAYLPIIYYRIDSVMLTLFHGFRETGIYGAGFKLREVFLLLPQSIMIILFPSISASYKEKSYLHQIFKDSVKGLLPLSFFLSIMVIFFAHPLVSFIYGEDFWEVAKISKLLFSTLPLVFLNLILLSLLKGTGNEKKCAFYLLSLLGVKLFLNSLLIPCLASIGVVASTVTVDIALFILLFYYWKRWKAGIYPGNSNRANI